MEYVVIGGLARIAQGAEETTEKIEIVPSTHGDNPQRLRLALEDLEAVESADARRGTGSVLAGVFESSGGRVEVVPEPAGTRGGYDDLRRAMTREPIGRGLRIPIASIADLARLIAALGPDRDVLKLIDLRRLQSLTRSAADEPVG